METKNHFNTSSELHLQNRLTGYNLNDNEKAQVWQLAQSKDQSISAERNDFRNNYQDRYQAEYDRLKGQQQPHQELNYGPSQPSDAQLRQQAQRNVQQNHLNAIRNIERTTDQRIDQVLEHARQDGRGPSPDLQQDFQRAHDHDRR